MGKSIDTKEDKVNKVLTGIASHEIGNTITPTALAEEIGVHPNTLREKLDEYEVAKELGWRTVRDKSGKVRLIIREDDDLNLRKGIRDILKEILQLKNLIDEINTKNKKK